MASKVIISLPTTASFRNVVQANLERKQVPKQKTASVENASNVTEAVGNDCNTLNYTSDKNTLSRIDELERVIVFLKDEQKRMLSSLHQEIASLQAKNRDLLCQLTFNVENNLVCQNSIDDSDIEYVLMNEISNKSPSTNAINKEQSAPPSGCESSTISVDENHKQTYMIDQQQQLQQREIEYLKEQLELASVVNKARTRGSRQIDNYIREMEDRNRDQEKVIRLLRKENKDRKIEIENLRKTVSSMRMPKHAPQNVQIVQPQTQLFPAVGTPSTFWYHNRPIPITEYHQLQRTSISANGEDRATTNSMANVQFSLPPVCNYRQIAATTTLPPPPRFYSNETVAATATGCYYSVAPRPILRNKAYVFRSERGHGEGGGTHVQHRSASTNSNV